MSDSVETEAAHAMRHPKIHNTEELREHVRIVPVQIRLFGIERGVKIIARLLVKNPIAPRYVLKGIYGFQEIFAVFAPHIKIPSRTRARTARFDEPRMHGGCVV